MRHGYYKRGEGFKDITKTTKSITNQPNYKNREKIDPENFSPTAGIKILIRITQFQ